MTETKFLANKVPRPFPRWRASGANDPSLPVCEKRQKMSMFTGKVFLSPKVPTMRNYPGERCKRDHGGWAQLTTQAVVALHWRCPQEVTTSDHHKPQVHTRESADIEECAANYWPRATRSHATEVLASFELPVMQISEVYNVEGQHPVERCTVPTWNFHVSMTVPPCLATSGSISSRSASYTWGLHM